MKKTKHTPESIRALLTQLKKTPSEKRTLNERSRLAHYEKLLKEHTASAQPERSTKLPQEGLPGHFSERDVQRLLEIVDIIERHLALLKRELRR